MFSRDSEYHKNNTDKTVIIDYIGGEPLLHPKLLRGIFEYCEEIKSDYNIDTVLHSISTNGTLIDSPKCIELIRDFKNQVLLGISVDGTKEKHDKHRLTISGSGSYDSVINGVRVAKEIGVRHLNFKATFTKATIGLYFDSFKNLVSLGPDSFHMNFAFEEVIDEFSGIQIALEMMNCLEFYFTLPKKDRPDVSMFLENNEVLASYNPMRGESVSKLTENRCGTAGEMSCLGFNRKLYGCNRFVSMSRPGMELGMLNDDASITHINQELKSNILGAFKSLPKFCTTCRHNRKCADCVAVSYDEGISPDELYSQRRQCGFTKAKELVRVWSKELMIREKLRDRYE